MGPGLHTLFYERLKLVSLSGLCVKGGQLVGLYVGRRKGRRGRDWIAWRFTFSQRPIEFELQTLENQPTDNELVVFHLPLNAEIHPPF